ncbi:MAG: hypothetical protein ACI4JB_11495 [Porcipelethomonas sp.]
MEILIPSVVSAVVCCIVLTAVFFFIPGFSDRRNELIKKSIIFTAAAAAIILIAGTFLNELTFFRKAPSAVTGAAAAGAGYFGFVIKQFVTGDNVRQFLKRLGIAAVTVFVLETVIFNFRSFTTDKQEYAVDLSQAVADNAEQSSFADDSVTFSADNTITFDAPSDDIRSVSLRLEGLDKFFRCTISVMDDNFSQMAMPFGSKCTSGEYGEPVSFAISPYGKISGIKVTITESYAPVTISSVVLRTAMPYRFSDTRFVLLLVIVAGILAIVSFRLYKVSYNRRRVLHKCIMAGVTVVCASVTFIFNIPEEDDKPIDYSSITDMTYQDPYVQMFDAVMNGRTYLDIEPDPDLLALDNPYDYSLREPKDEKGIEYPWDRALYNGKYYSYYGITPVLVFYFPYYWITGNLPTMNTASIFFGVFMILFMFGAILAFVKRFVKKPNFMLLIVASVTMCFVSGIFLAVHYSSLYNIPVVTSACFLMLCLWSGVEGYSHIHEKKSIPLFILSGIAFILCLSARPSKAISALILAPLFIKILLSKRLSLKKKLSSAAAFVVPVAIGMTAVMLYNYARFESPFDFGQSYQLTVCNANASQIDFGLFPISIFYYFFQPFALSGDFPYFSINNVVLTNNTKSIYIAASCGIFNFPVLLVGTVLMLFLVWHTRYRRGTPYSYNNLRVKNYTYILMLVLMIALAFIDFCKAGIIIDYQNDILPVMALMSLLVMLDIQKRTEKYPAISGKLVCGFSIVSVLSIIIFAALVLSIHDYSLYKHSPNILFELEKLVCFWH